MYFPAIIARIPELREELLVSRVFLNRRSRAFDIAAMGAIVALSSRSPLPLGLAAPYAWVAAKSARRWGRAEAPRALAGDLLADVIGCSALVVGSIRNRTPVL